MILQAAREYNIVVNDILEVGEFIASGIGNNCHLEFG